jgi:hypothetical protein
MGEPVIASPRCAGPAVIPFGLDYAQTLPITNRSERSSSTISPARNSRSRKSRGSTSKPVPFASGSRRCLSSRVNVLYFGAGNTRESHLAGPRVQLDTPGAEQSPATIGSSTTSLLLSFWNIPNQCQNSQKLFG